MNDLSEHVDTRLAGRIRARRVVDVLLEQVPFGAVIASAKPALSVGM